MYHRPLDFRGIAHDINNVVARASLASERLAAHPDPMVRRQAARIAAAMEDISTICRQQMSASLVESSGEICHAGDLERLMRRVGEMCGAGGAGINVTIAVDEDACLRCHPSSLMRVLFNLAINAVRAIDLHGGTGIELTARRDGAHVVFSVSDDGPGMPSSILDSLRPRCSCVPQPVARVGTGLYVAASLARDLGGELLLMESSSKGTRFDLTLPAHTVPDLRIPMPVEEVRECVLEPS